jgi:hypothetical protein
MNTLRLPAVSTIAALVASALVEAAASTAAARTWRVARDGSGDFRTIQPAVDAAAPGDTVLIGAGRYRESSIFPFDNELGGGETFVGLSVSDLTLIGVQRDSVVIGPDVPNFQGFDPTGIAMRLDHALNLRVQQLTIQNVYNGLRLRGHADVAMCQVTGCGIGLFGFTESGLRVANCLFTRCTYWGLSTYPPASNTEVLDTQFVDNPGGGAVFSFAINTNVRRCYFRPCGIIYDRLGTGIVERSEFDIEENGGAVSLSGGSNIQVLDNRLRGSGAKIIAGGHSNVTGSGNYIESGPVAWALRIGGETTVDLRHNDFVLGLAPTVHLESYMNAQQPVHLNLIDNYWGTANADTMAAHIWDGNDDPQVHGFVDFQPFATTSVPAQSISVGGLKSRFGGDQAPGKVGAVHK